MATIVEIVYPAETPSLNRWQRKHWGERRRIKDELTALCVEEAEKQRAPNLRVNPRRVRVVITRYSAGRLDHDNLVGGCKPLVDALVRAGLAVDDSTEWIEVEYRQGKAQRGDGSTIVFVEIPDEVSP